MNIENPLKNAPFEALPRPFEVEPMAEGMQISPKVKKLVETQVQALVESSPNFHQLSDAQREEMFNDLVKINTYTAALVQEDWSLSKKLGQTPILHEQSVITPFSQPLENRETIAQAQANQPAPPPPPAEEFSPRAANQVARITRDTLNAVAFPTFVADLIKGTFQAIVNASIQQMEAYANLLSNVAKTVDQFMADNITDNQARDYLVGRYPEHLKVEVGEDAARIRTRDTDLPPPNFKGDLGLGEDVSLDDDSVEEKLVPAARRSLAQQRHSLLSTMVLMGINRIVVTSGRIKAGMKFHIDARDTGSAQTASQFDFSHEHRTRIGFGGGLASWLGGPGGESETKTSVSYVSTSKKESSDELNVAADLNGEVEVKFKSDYFPMEKLANPQMFALIQGHTPNPPANTPNTQTNNPPPTNP